MHIMQIVKVRLTAKSADELSANQYKAAEDWLGNWTPVANFRAVIADSEKSALAKCQKMLTDGLVPAWLRGAAPEHFEFQVSEQAVKDGTFWMSTSTVLGHWYSVPAKEVQEKVAA